MTVYRGLFYCGLLLLCLLAPARAAPQAEPWPRWTAHDEANPAAIDHGDWDALLGAHLVASPDGINRFAYGALGEADRGRLDAYLARLAALPISAYRRDEQRAYWINLYNALTVAQVAAAWPVDSIREIRSGLFSAGPWGLELIEVEGQPLTLDDIEHRILRPIWRDPRIHYAVNCASLGCPNLQPDAFTAANTEALLERGAREYVNHPRGARIENGRLVVSSIYAWFEEDFGGDDAGVIAHLRRYADGPLAERLAGIDRVADDDYDWSVNASPAD